MKNLSASWLKGCLLAVVATGLGYLLRVAPLDLPAWVFPLVSLLAFAVGTIGRVGWESQTWDGKSPTEVWDRRLFLGCYFVGIVAGVACLPGK